MKSDFETALLDSGQWMKKGATALLNNLGKTVAAVTAIVACLVTFTDVTFSRLDAEHITASLLLLLLASYMIFFSLESAGEQLGEGSDEYRRARAHLSAVQEKITGEDLLPLRDFLSRYAEAEVTYRRRNELLAYGIPEEDYHAWIAGKKKPPLKTRHVMRRVRRMRAITPVPRTLLSEERRGSKSELRDPGSTKYLRLILRLIPSTLSVLLTVSVMLTGREGMTAADVIDGILKLSTLPMVGLKGYAAGYTYTRHTLPVWMETKVRLLTAFLGEKQTEKMQKTA